MDIITYALAKKLCKSALSGVKNYRVDGLNLIINLNDGNSLTMTFPVPKLEAAELKSAIIEFDGVNQSFNLPVNDVKLNVYVNGIYLTEDVDYRIDRQVKPNKITFDAIYDRFDGCTVTYLEALSGGSGGSGGGGGSIDFDNIDFASPDDIDKLFQDGVGPITGVETYATMDDIDKMFAE